MTPLLRLAGSTLTSAALQTIVSAAITRLAAAGLDTSIPADAQVRVANLDDELGLAGSQLVLIDDDAAGAGWFIDATPFDDWRL